MWERPPIFSALRILLLFSPTLLLLFSHRTLPARHIEPTELPPALRQGPSPCFAHPVTEKGHPFFSAPLTRAIRRRLGTKDWVPHPARLNPFANSLTTPPDTVVSLMCLRASPPVASSHFEALADHLKATSGQIVRYRLLEFFLTVRGP